MDVLGLQTPLGAVSTNFATKYTAGPLFVCARPHAVLVQVLCSADEYGRGAVPVAHFRLAGEVCYRLQF